MSPDKIAELRVKHLEMINLVVARLSSTGSAQKTYCITVSTAVLGLAATLQRPIVCLVALFPIAMFALIDAQYLSIERDFRKHFDKFRVEDWSTITSFDMKATSSKDYWSAFVSWSVAWFYGALSTAVVCITASMGLVHGRLF